MPIELNSLFQQASALEESRQFHVSDDGRMLGGTALHGLKKLSTSAHAAENRETVQAFMRAMEQHPAYAAILDQVRAPLDELLRTGKPLTAGMIKQTELALNVAAAMNVGRQLADAGQIPPGHGASFGIFAASRNMPVDTPAGQTAALREYLLNEVCSRHTTELTKLPDMGEKNAAVRRLMTALHAPLTGTKGFFAGVIDRALAGGPDAFSFEAFTNAFADACADDLDVAHHLDERVINSIAGNPDAPNIMAALREALPVLGGDSMEQLRQALFSAPSLNTHAQRVSAVTAYLTDVTGTKAAEGVMTSFGLPESFAMAVGHNPEVVARAREMLATDPGADRMPTRQQVMDALTQSAHRFTQEKLPLLQEFVKMAGDPPVDLRPPLTMENMPRYINTMLAGDELLEPLLHDNAPVDAAMLEKLIVHAEAMNSATHAFRGEFGADDVARVLSNSIRLLMARRGVPQQMLPEMVTRVINKFGRLASELASINTEMQQNRFGAEGMALLSKGMTMYRALEGYAAALIGMLTDEQRTRMHLEMFNDPSSEEQTSEIKKQRNGFIERTFQHLTPMDRISDMVRDFARREGVALPDMNPAVAARSQREEESRLSGDNRSMGQVVLSALIPSTGQVVEKNTSEFRTFLEDMSSRHPLSSIDADKVDLTSLSPEVGRIVNRMADEASEAGRAVDPAQLRSAAEEALLQGLQKLQETLDAVDALPEARGAGTHGFSVEEKAVMKDLVQRFGIRDAGIVAVLAEGARENGFRFALEGLAAPVGSARQIGEECRCIGSKYLAVRERLPESFAGSEDAMPLMIALGMRFHGISGAKAAHLAANMSSDTAKKVASSLLWLTEQHPSSERTKLIMSVYASMDVLRMESEVASSGNLERNPMYFAGSLAHPSEIPGGPGGIMDMISSLSGGIISPADVELSRHNPPFTSAEWNTLKSVIHALQGSAQGSSVAFLLPAWIGTSGEAVLAAVEANGGSMPTMQQMWNILTGGQLGRMPRSMNRPDGLGYMMDYIHTAYQRRVMAAVPDMPEAQCAAIMTNVSTCGVSPRKLLELTQPGSSLSLDDIHMDMSMSSLRGIDESTAYGLAVDFRRQSSQAVLTFARADGRTMIMHPFWIPNEENRPNHDAFVQITDFWRGMCRSEEQMRRLAQAFSQASLITPRIMSTMFPGVEYSEHGSFDMRAGQQPDGSVVVDIRTDPASPITMHEQFVIQPDGSHRCTVFDMHRPALN